MADPVVHITNGIPDSGTGNITTLGAVVSALGSPMQTSGGSVTANIGTPGSLALETGGNLAAAAGGIGTAADAVVAAGAAGSISAKLRAISRDLVANIVLAAGTAILGKVGIDQTTPGTTDSVSVKSQGFSAAVSVTRPANTTAYTANNVVGAASAAWTFANMGPSGKEILITSAALEVDQSAVISGETSYRLYLYNVTPPSALADGAGWDLPSGDRASFLGFIDLGTPIDLGSTCYCELNLINKQITLSGTSLFGYLVTNGAFTPTSARVQKITLHSVAV